jgi:hypothetical protein
MLRNSSALLTYINEEALGLVLSCFEGDVASTANKEFGSVNWIV